MPSKPKPSTTKESEVDVLNSASDTVCVTRSDSEVLCAHLVSSLVNQASDMTLNTSDDTDVNSELKYHSATDVIKSDTDEPCSSSPASEDFCEAREDLSQLEQSSCKDGDVDS